VGFEIASLTDSFMSQPRTKNMNRIEQSRQGKMYLQIGSKSALPS